MVSFGGFAGVLVVRGLAEVDPTVGEVGRPEVVPEVRDLVKYRHIDLRQPTWALPSDFHVIFCRNVSIYFSDEERLVLLERLSHHLRPGGWLIMGNGEILPSVPASLRKHSPSLYQREA